MSFINKSVNYAQTVLLKTKFLAPVLKTYNNSVKQYINETDLCLRYHIVPNNNQKYYLFITKKAHIEASKEDYNILYFFPDEETVQFAQRSKVAVHHVSDFFMEINNTFQEDILLEGYMYKRGDKFTYLITDILYKNGKVVDVDYDFRHCLINELTMNLQLSSLNDHLSIGIHPVFSSENKNMVSIFLNNFVFCDDICSLETVQKHNKIRRLKSDVLKLPMETKRIEKGSYADVYNVFHLESGDEQGILYVKGLHESTKMKELMRGCVSAQLRCRFSSDFNKWEPILD